MTWRIFTGTGRPAGDVDPDLPDPPPWRDRRTAITKFVRSEALVDAVNAALHLRRPLLLTGPPGSGKSTLLNLIAAELRLGEPLNWHVTSRSTLADALYQYDALGRLHATQMRDGGTGGPVEIDDFVTLGPLGTALASDGRPRAVLIDEIDKSDFDLPGDLLNVLEDGEFGIPVLQRDAKAAAGDPARAVHRVRGADRRVYAVTNGVVRRSQWPVIVLTSNGERTFPAPFLRRCVRFEIPAATEEHIREVVTGHLGHAGGAEAAMIHRFAERVLAGETLAVDQLLNLLHLVSGRVAEPAARERLEEILLAELNGR